MRRIEVMADIDPFSAEDRRSQIHLRHRGEQYLVHVQSRPSFGGGYLWLSLQPGEAVEVE